MVYPYFVTLTFININRHVRQYACATKTNVLIKSTHSLPGEQRKKTNKKFKNQ